MNKYTVVLLCPETIATDAVETMLRHVEANDVRSAVAIAQDDANDLTGNTGFIFLPLIVLEGHQKDLLPGMLQDFFSSYPKPV